MSINRRVCRGEGDRSRLKASGGKLQDRVDLFARNVELLDDFINVRASFEIQEHGG